jgi:hypothetical protein
VRQQSRDEAKGAAADSRVAAAAHASPASGLTADDGQPQPGSKATACEPGLEAKAAPELTHFGGVKRRKSIRQRMFGKSGASVAHRKLERISPM